jgi:hypothetical protein
MRFQNEVWLIAAQGDDAVVVEIPQGLGLAESFDVAESGIGMVMDREETALDQIRLGGAGRRRRIATSASRMARSNSSLVRSSSMCTSG